MLLRDLPCSCIAGFGEDLLSGPLPWLPFYTSQPRLLWVGSPLLLGGGFRSCDQVSPGSSALRSLV